jgi:hypothetical protein
VGVIAALSLHLALPGGAVHAQPTAPDAEAETLTRQGLELRRLNRDREALELFRRAYQLNPTPRIRGQMGLAAAAAGLWVEAESYLREALSADDDWTRRRRPALQQALEISERYLASLDVQGGPAGAEVRVNGRLVARLPLDRPVRVVAGSALLEVRAPGHVPLSRNLIAPAGTLVRQTVELVPDPAARAPSEAPVAAPVSRALPGAPAPRDGGASSDDSATGGRRRALRIAAWSSLVAAVGLVAVGAAGSALRQSQAQSYNSTCNVPGTLPAGCSDQEAAFNRDRALQIAGFAAGGALAGATALLFYLSRRPAGDRVAAALPRWSLGGGPGRAVLTLEGGF